jgi:hypothetical protein
MHSIKVGIYQCALIVFVATWIGQAASARAKLTLEVTNPLGPVDPGQLVQVTLSMSEIGPTPAAGFQAFLEFNSNELTFINGSYTPVPFGLAVIAPVTAVGNTINLAAGINQLAGQMPSSADAPLAYLTFMSVTGGCEVLSVQFRPHDPPTRLTTLAGAEILPLTLIGLLPTPPTCPPDIDKNDIVNIDDLLFVINGWGRCPPDPQCCPPDIDENNVVNIDDLLFVINGWGPCP